MMIARGTLGQRAHAAYGGEEPPAGGDGGGGANTSMLGHLDTTIRSAPAPVLTEAELEAATEAEDLDTTLLEQIQNVRHRGASRRRLAGMAIVMDPQYVAGRWYKSMAVLHGCCTERVTRDAPFTCLVCRPRAVVFVTCTAAATL